MYIILRYHSTAFKFLFFRFFFFPCTLRKFPTPWNWENNAKMMAFFVVNKISSPLGIFKSFSPFPKINLSKNFAARKNAVYVHTSSQTCEVCLTSKVIRRRFLSALVNIFRKAEEDHNKTVETCKAALQLYFLNFKTLKNWYRIFFQNFFLLWTFSASWSDKSALIRDLTKTRRFCVILKTLHENLILLIILMAGMLIPC